MNTILLTAAMAVTLLVVLFVVWGGVQLLANRQLGLRRMGCRGPRTNAYGKQVCCQTGEACEHVEQEQERAGAGR